MINLNSIPQIQAMIGGFRNQLLEQSLPPYNLVKLDENTYELELSAIGFNKDELAVKLKGDTLFITGEKKPIANSSVFAPDVHYIHNSLFFKKFTREWKMDAGLKVGKISLKNGILSVILEHAALETDTQYIKLSIE